MNYVIDVIVNEDLLQRSGDLQNHPLGMCLSWGPAWMFMHVCKQLT